METKIKAIAEELARARRKSWWNYFNKDKPYVECLTCLNQDVNKYLNQISGLHIEDQLILVQWYESGKLSHDINVCI